MSRAPTWSAIRTSLRIARSTRVSCSRGQSWPNGLCLPRPTKLELGDPFDNDGAFYLAMERFGYDISDGRKSVEAFQRRWRPELIDGVIDGEIRAILFQLLLDRDRGLAR